MGNLLRGKEILARNLAVFRRGCLPDSWDVLSDALSFNVSYILLIESKYRTKV